MALREVTMNDGDAVNPGQRYVCDGRPTVCPNGVSTVSGLKAATGATTVKTCDVPGRRTQMWTAGRHAGTDIFLT
jgi:hypothetical protein